MHTPQGEDALTGGAWTANRIQRDAIVDDFENSSVNKESVTAWKPTDSSQACVDGSEAQNNDDAPTNEESQQAQTASHAEIHTEQTEAGVENMFPSTTHDPEKFRPLTRASTRHSSRSFAASRPVTARPTTGAVLPQLLPLCPNSCHDLSIFASLHVHFFHRQRKEESSSCLCHQCAYMRKKKKNAYVNTFISWNLHE